MTQPISLPKDEAIVARSESSRLRAARRLVLYAVLTCMGFYVVVISAGEMFTWPRYTARYDILAQGFLLGQCNLPLHSNPRHLRLPDPYDPIANTIYRHQPYIPDSLLFQGKFYMYWGPVPAVLMVPVRWLRGSGAPIGDHYLVFAFVSGALVVSSRLLLRLWTRHFSEQPLWMLIAAVFVAGLTTPMPGLMARAAVYEAAIAGGQFFLLAGVYIAWIALTEPQRPIIRLALAGVCLAAAVGCRVSLALAVPAVALLVVTRIALGAVRRSRNGDRGHVFGALVQVTAFSVPLCLGAFGLAYYNCVRFGSWLEFGQRFQLGEGNYHAVRLFGPGNVIPGLFTYFLRTVQYGGTGMLITAISGSETFPSFIHLPEHYECFEPISGILTVNSFLWLAIVPAVGLVYSIVAALKRLRRGHAIDHLWHGRSGELNWLLGCLFCASLIGFAPVLFMIGTSQRYLADLTPALVICAAIGMWQGARRLDCHPARTRRWFGKWVVGLAVVSIWFGTLLAIDGTSGHFRTWNPHLLDQLSYRTGGK